MFYLTIIIFFIICVVVFDIKKQTNDKDVAYFICFLLLTIMCSIRYKVGGDSLAYENYYANMPDLSNMVDYMEFNPLQYQPFWIFLVSFCRSITKEFYFFQFIHALLFNISLFVFIRRYTQHIFSTLLLLFLSLMYFYYGFEIQRETLSLSVFLFNIKNLEKNRWTKYYLLATVSFLFHISAIILFFLPLFKRVKLTKKMIFILLFFSAILFFFKDIIFSVLTPFLILESMKDKADIYSGMSFSLIGFISFFIVRVILLLPFLAYRITSKSSEYKWFDFLFLFISILSQYFVGFERLLNYFYPIYFILFINFIYEKKTLELGILAKKLIVVITLVHIFFIIDYKLFIKNPAGQHYYSLFFPYETIFVPVDVHEREDFYYNQW